jgi:hypothetical protein
MTASVLDVMYGGKLAPVKAKWESVARRTGPADLDRFAAAAARLLETAPDSVFPEGRPKGAVPVVRARGPREAVGVALMLDGSFPGLDRAACPQEAAVSADKGFPGFFPDVPTFQRGAAFYAPGSFAAGRMAYIEALTVLGAVSAERAVPLLEASQSCAWWALFDDCAVAMDFPSRLLFDSDGLLHCDDGPAVEFADGSRHYAVHGTAVPAKLVEDPGSVTAADVAREHNTQVKRLMAAVCGARLAEGGGL